METTVLKAKNQLSDLLRRAELGEEIVIRRGTGGKAFRLVPIEPAPQLRTLEADPRWAGHIEYRDEDLFESEWREEA